MQRVIMHVDMNSYFASCEQQDNPAWRGKPLGVCEHLGGIIIAPSIEAKVWGVKTGMPVWEARKLYPRIILTPTSPDRYRFYTRRFLKVLFDYTDAVEKYSIDEAFLDLTAVVNIRRPLVSGGFGFVDPFEEAHRIGGEIQMRVGLEVGDWLRCSVGVAWNKLVAKIGSDMRKPAGLTVLRPRDKDWLYDRLALVDIPGIGKRMARRLAALHIRTLRDLRDASRSLLVSRFGINGQHLYAMGQLEGSFKEGFGGEESLKSIGHMYTIPREQRTSTALEPVLFQLSEMVATRLRAQGMSAGSVTAYMYTHEDESFGSTKRLGYMLRDGREIFLIARKMLRQGGVDSDDVPRLVGVTAGALSFVPNQPSLFPEDRHAKAVGDVLDSINAKYGPYTIGRTTAMGARGVIRDSLGFGRMKEFKVHPAGYGGRG